jgi:hypothetical protein
MAAVKLARGRLHPLGQAALHTKKSSQPNNLSEKPLLFSLRHDTGI